MRAMLASCLVALAAVSIAVHPAHTQTVNTVLSTVQAADSLPGPIPPSGPVFGLATAVIGVGAALATGLVRKGAGAVDSALGTVDKAVTKAIGPALPIVAVGFAAILPKLAGIIGLHTGIPDAAVIVSAPASAVVGIALRELYVKLFGSKNG